jgi:hypothetical protein
MIRKPYVAFGLHYYGPRDKLTSENIRICMVISLRLQNASRAMRQQDIVSSRYKNIYILLYSVLCKYYLPSTADPWWHSAGRKLDSRPGESFLEVCLLHQEKPGVMP